MGYDRDHFICHPSDNLMCHICHDIVEDSVNFGVCHYTHIFCHDCADSWKSQFSLGSTCPSCRAKVTNAYPDWSTRNVVESMEVTCLNVNYNTERDDSIDDIEICNWTGRCGDLREHQDECLLETLVCNNNGCKYKCIRRYMDAHLRDCKYQPFSLLTNYTQNDDSDQEIVLYGCGMQFINGTYQTYRRTANGPTIEDTLD